MQNGLGIKARRVLAEEIRQLSPGIEVDDDVVGRFEPEGGYIDPAKAIDTFGVLARGNGATTRLGVKDLEIEVDKGRVRGVHTNSGFFETPNVVLATGSWTSNILGTLGIEMPLSVVRTEECCLSIPPVSQADEMEDHLDGVDIESRFRPDPLELMPVPHPVILDLTRKFHAHCEPHSGQTRVGRLGLDAFKPVRNLENLDKQATPEFVKWARAAISERFAGFTRTWNTPVPFRTTPP